MITPLSAFLQKRFKLKRLFIFGTLCFILGTVIAVWSPDFTCLLLARLIQGVGTACMALSTFAMTGRPQHILLSIILAIPGFAGWIAPYFIYKKVAQKQTEKITPLMETKYDEIYEVCEKGNKLLY